MLSYFVFKCFPGFIYFAYVYVCAIHLLHLEGDSSLETTSGRYNESTATMEKLAVLTAWAEVCAILMATN